MNAESSVTTGHVGYGLQALCDLGPTIDEQIDAVQLMASFDGSGVKQTVNRRVAQNLHFLLWRLACGRADPDGRE